MSSCVCVKATTRYARVYIYMKRPETAVDPFSAALSSIQWEIGSLIEVELSDLALEAVQSLNSSVLELQAGDEIQVFMLA